MRIAFIHVPKCAGMAVGTALRDTYFSRSRRWLARLTGRSSLRTVNVDASASTGTARALGIPLPEVRLALLHYHLQDRTIGYVSGHVPVEPALLDEFREQWHFVTMLRRPVDRFVSEYLYNRYKASDHFEITQDVETFLDTPDARRLGSQLVNFLTGRPDVTATPTERDVAEAIRSLDRFSVVGVTERMDEFASDVTERFGRTPPISKANRNPAPQHARGFLEDPDIMEEIERLNEADSVVYQHALGLVGRGAAREP